MTQMQTQTQTYVSPWASRASRDAARPYHRVLAALLQALDDARISCRAVLDLDPDGYPRPDEYATRWGWIQADAEILLGLLEWVYPIVEGESPPWCFPRGVLERDARNDAREMGADYQKVLRRSLDRKRRLLGYR